jgi:hypothetical protein
MGITGPPEVMKAVHTAGRLLGPRGFSSPLWSPDISRVSGLNRVGTFRYPDFIGAILPLQFPTPSSQFANRQPMRAGDMLAGRMR